MSQDSTQAQVINSRTFVVGAGAAALALVAPNGAIDAELARRELAPEGDQDDATKAALLLAGVRSQGDFAAQVLNVCDGKVDPDDLTRALKEAFPGARISKRHGPHYMSHARSGKLNGLRDGMVIPHRAKRSKAPTEEPEASTPEPTKPVTIEIAEPVTAQALMEVNDRKALQRLAKEAGVSAGGKTMVIAQRIVDYQQQASA